MGIGNTICTKEMYGWDFKKNISNFQKLSFLKNFDKNFNKNFQKFKFQITTLQIIISKIPTVQIKNVQIYLVPHSLFLKMFKRLYIKYI